MPRTLSRRAALAGFAGTSTAALLGGAPSGRAQAGKVVRVTHFGGPYAALGSLLGQPFTAESGVRVEYESENSVSAVTKLQSQRDTPPFDVVMLSRGVSVRAGSGGLLAPLPPGAIRAASLLVEGAMAPRSYGVAMLLDAIDVMVDKSRLPRPIESWLDLWRPEFQGKVTLPSASLPIYFVLMQVARALTGDAKAPASIDAAFRKLRELRPNVRTFYGDPVQASQMIESGDVVAAVQFGGRIAPVMQKNPNIDHATPKEGVAGVPYDLCLVARGRDPEAALAYIDFATRKESQAALGAQLLVTPAHREAVVPSDKARFVIPSDRIWFPDEEYAAAQSAEWSRRWQREVQA